MLARINLLIKECMRDPFRGTGKPEPLDGNLTGWWSRRINHEHRLVYRVTGKAKRRRWKCRSAAIIIEWHVRREHPRRRRNASDPGDLRSGAAVTGPPAQFARADGLALLQAPVRLGKESAAAVSRACGEGASDQLGLFTVVRELRP